jgi:hypothetical protein
MAERRAFHPAAVLDRWATRLADLLSGTRRFARRPCEHPITWALALRVRDQWTIEALCQKCRAPVLIPTGTLLAVAILESNIATACGPKDSGVAHIMDVVRRSA